MPFKSEERPQAKPRSGPQQLKPALEEAPRGPARCESSCLGTENSFGVALEVPGDV